MSLFFLNDSRGWMVTDHGLWSTEEGGRSWTKIESRKEFCRRVSWIPITATSRALQGLVRGNHRWRKEMDASWRRAADGPDHSTPLRHHLVPGLAWHYCRRERPECRRRPIAVDPAPEQAKRGPARLSWRLSMAARIGVRASLRFDAELARLRLSSKARWSLLVCITIPSLRWARRCSRHPWDKRQAHDLRRTRSRRHRCRRAARWQRHPGRRRAARQFARKFRFRAS